MKPSRIELFGEWIAIIITSVVASLWVTSPAHAGAGPCVLRVPSMLTMLDETVASVRRIAGDLRPLMLDDLGPAAFHRCTPGASLEILQCEVVALTVQGHLVI